MRELQSQTPNGPSYGIWDRDADAFESMAMPRSAAGRNATWAVKPVVSPVWLMTRTPRYSPLILAAGLPADAPTPAADRARVRTEVAR